MFDIGASELLMIIIVAVVVIGPKDMPAALRTAGRWIGKMRKASNHFRSGLDAMVREAELEDMERKWREQNEAIMKSSPQLPTAEEMQAPLTSLAALPPVTVEAVAVEAVAAEAGPDAAAADAESQPAATGDKSRQAEFHLPPPPP